MGAQEAERGDQDAVRGLRHDDDDQGGHGVSFTETTEPEESYKEDADVGDTELLPRRAAVAKLSPRAAAAKLSPRAAAAKLSAKRTAMKTAAPRCAARCSPKMYGCT